MTEDVPRAAAPRPRAAAAAALFFAAATVLFTWPMAPRAATGLADLWDAKLTAWILNWDYHQTFREPLRLFHANIFHPARYALAFSENLYGVALFGFPLYAAGVSALAAANALFLLGMFLSALAAWALAREMTGDAAASLLAGLVYAFLPWRISQIPHLQFQWGAFLPLLLLFLLRYLDRGRRRDLLLFGGCFAWNALANVHYGVFAGVGLAVVLVIEGISNRALARRRIWKLLLAMGAAALVVLPFYLPYAAAARLYGMKRSFGEMRFFSGGLGDFLSAGSRNKLYGSLTRRFAHPEGDFFPGVVAFALGVFAVLRLRCRGRDPKPESRPPEVRRSAVRILDALTAGVLLLWAAAVARPGLRLGPVGLGDSGRVLLLAAGLFLVRLVVSFPRRSRYRDLGDWLRRNGFDRRVTALLAVGATGFLLALGAHTPIYRFLFQSFSPLFRGIRAPSRGIVLFDLSLAVLAAWGLSLAAGPARSRRRIAIVSAALALTAWEYRAFPIEVHPVEARAPEVYRWLASRSLPGGVMEWPLGPEYDFEYEFRSTAHWKPLVNGSSGFFPKEYLRLSEDLRRDLVPDSVWDRVREVDAAVLIFHPHDAPPAFLLRGASAVKRAVAAGRLEPLAVFPHAPDRDYVFRVTSASPFDTGLSADARIRAGEAFRDLTVRPGWDVSPPAMHLDFPTENLTVSAGQWAYGWALDDSGIAEVRVATESGPVGLAVYGSARPDVERVLPGYPGSPRFGFHFAIPNLPSGRHTLVLTVVARDGGSTVLRRNVRVR